MQKTILFAFLGFALSFCIAACKECHTKYIFEVPHKVYSSHDTLSIGDTLWVETEFCENLYDKLSNKTYTIDPDLLSAGMSILNSDTTKSFNCLPFFDIYNSVGSIRKGSRVLFIDYVYQNHTYKLKSAFIPLRKGTYTLYFTLNYPEPRLPINFDDKCKTELGWVYFNTNQLANNGFDLYAASIRGQQDNQKQYYSNGGGFTFKVK